MNKNPRLDVEDEWEDDYYWDDDEEYDPCEGCLKFDGSYNCKHCEHGDDGNYSIWDIYLPSELF